MAKGILTQSEQIESARAWFADSYDAMKHEASTGAVWVNNLPAYCEWCDSQKAIVLAGGMDHTFTFRQRMHYFATGECVPLLPAVRQAKRNGWQEKE